MNCPVCNKPMREHEWLPLYRCQNVKCYEFDRFKRAVEPQTKPAGEALGIPAG